MNDKPTTKPLHPKRPIGVWLLTVYAGLVAGVLPLAVVIVALVTSNVFEEAGVGGLGLALSTLLNLGVIVSAIGAWRGNNNFRRALLLLITAHYVLIAVNNFTFLAAGQVPSDEQGRLWGRVLRGFLYPAIYIWYFNRSATKAFFNPVSTSLDQTTPTK